MLQTNFTTIQDIRRNYKKVIDEVNITNTPTVVISNNKPQFAIVSIKMLKEMQANVTQASARGLLSLAKWAEKEQVKGPRDLSQKHNDYIWKKQSGRGGGN